jgi:hypothetical protein
MKVDRISEQTSWPCYKSTVMSDNIGREYRAYDSLAIGTV